MTVLVGTGFSEVSGALRSVPSGLADWLAFWAGAQVAEHISMAMNKRSCLIGFGVILSGARLGRRDRFIDRGVRRAKDLHFNWSITRQPNYLHSTRLSCEAITCHLPPRFSHVSVQTWHTFAFGWEASFPTACSLP